MNDLLTTLNHLLQKALEGGDQTGSVQVRGLVLDGEGARIVLWCEHPLARGEAVLRLTVEAAREQRQTLRLTLDQGPPELGALLEPFRKLLEKSRVSIDLDFSP